MPKADVVNGKGVSYDRPDGVADWTWDLIAGQSTKVGTVHLYNDAANLYVEYTLVTPWLMKDAHVYVGTDKPDAKGNPGGFPYGMTFALPGVDHYIFTIPKSEHLTSVALKGGSFYIAVHASVSNDGLTWQTLWGGRWDSQNNSASYEFGWSKKWGGYFTGYWTPVFTPFEMDFKGQFPNSEPSYWLLTFDGTQHTPPADYFPPFIWPGNAVRGWCVDPQYLWNNHTVHATVISCYDPILNTAEYSYMASENWDVISYMINERYTNPSSSFASATWKSFQKAVWYFKYGNYEVNTSGNYDWVGSYDSETNGLISAAAAGEGYVPSGAGDYFACILWPGTTSPDQMNYQPDPDPPTHAQTLIIGIDP